MLCSAHCPHTPNVMLIVRQISRLGGGTISPKSTDGSASLLGGDANYIESYESKVSHAFNGRAVIKFVSTIIERRHITTKRSDSYLLTIITTIVMTAAKKTNPPNTASAIMPPILSRAVAALVLDRR